MKYQSIKEICREFNLDASLSVEEMIDELTELQSKLHPDVNPDFSDSDLKIFSNADIAIDFLRAIRSQTMVPVSEVVDLVGKFFKNKINNIEYEEKLSERVSKSSERIVKNVKDFYFPKKFSIISFAILICIVNVIFFLIVNSGLIPDYSNYFVNLFYLFIIIFWFVSFTILFSCFMRIIKREFMIKRALNNLINTDLQFEILNGFIGKRNNKEAFTRDELEDYINEHIYENFYHSSYKEVYSYTKELAPKLADLIIFRALKKSFITEVRDSWSDKYVINPRMF